MTSPAAVAAPPPPEVRPVLSGLLRDALLLAERGTATPSDIDTAMRLGAGHPAGRGGGQLTTCCWSIHMTCQALPSGSVKLPV